MASNELLKKAINSINKGNISEAIDFIQISEGKWILQSLKKNVTNEIHLEVVYNEILVLLREKITQQQNITLNRLEKYIKELCKEQTELYKEIKSNNYKDEVQRSRNIELNRLKNKHPNIFKHIENLSFRNKINNFIEKPLITEGLNIAGKDAITEVTELLNNKKSYCGENPKLDIKSLLLIVLIDIFDISPDLIARRLGSIGYDIKTGNSASKQLNGRWKKIGKTVIAILKNKIHGRYK